LTKLAPQTELQAAVIFAVREHTKTLRSFFSLIEAIDQWLREFGWSFGLQNDTMDINVNIKQLSIAILKPVT